MGTIPVLKPQEVIKILHVLGFAEVMSAVYQRVPADATRGDDFRRWRVVYGRYCAAELGRYVS